MLTDWLLVLAGGLIGAPARYLTGVAVKSRVHSPFPFGTLTANAAACLLLGFLSEAVLRGHLGPRPELFLATGFCGALSTWSTFSYEVFTLASTRRIALSGLYLAVSVLLGTALSFAGAAVASALW
ncbi:fluoride efflux transporter FluC [Kitasatospora cheerisanensis]|uniref:Fluoride-specific ion channel FluC n=1 Tax=Kitasatospora cheerisanensis KCTC 2395 TaxID=1348663 RepID=A0A066YIL6_9ACTN|nr:CrcB family protein [Kitasatospora cheerisanensis]KDN81002.1 chromosome condensation protein CrcB [Kitasatospora cheerisanensis KCTC 2395]